MKTKILNIAVFSFMLMACSSVQNNAHNSQNSLDWDGVYKGTTSSTEAVCSGITTILTINKDLTYTAKSACIESLNTITETNGTFTWNKLGSEITLVDSNSKDKAIYQVQENRLRKISENGKKLTYSSTDLYVYNKISVEDITEKYWKLIELNGQVIVNTGQYNREPHLILKAQDKKVNGTGGCNFFNGSYELGNLNRITFSKVATTQMACMDMETEAALLKIFETVDNYTLSSDGHYLSLNKGRMAPLARFEVVYLK